MPRLFRAGRAYAPQIVLAAFDFPALAAIRKLREGQALNSQEKL
jgi:hypothetical protein